MHSMKWFCLFASALLALSTSAQAPRTGPDNRYRIALSVDGQLVRGSQDLEAAMKGKTKEEQLALQAETIPELQGGQSVRLIVSVTDPEGVTRSNGHGQRVAFETFGCLDIAGSGRMKVVSQADCTLPEYPMLFVIYKDEAGEPLSYSEFVFKVRSPHIDGKGTTRETPRGPSATR
jgi:hypothetical protein